MYVSRQTTQWLCLAALVLGSSCSATHAGAPTVAKSGRLQLPSQPLDPSLLAPSVLDRVKNATVLIGAFENGQLTCTGSGFAVGNGTRIVTNKHVATGTGEAPDYLKIVFFSGTTRARIVRVSPQSVTLYGSLHRDDKDYHKEDLAFLSIGAKVAEPLEIAEAETLQETMPVWALGFPRGTGLLSDQDMPSVTVHSLRVERIERSGAAVTLLQLSGSPTYGNSGGPVVDRQGRVIGVIEAKDVSAPILFAIPSARINKMLTGQAPASDTVAEEFAAPFGEGTGTRPGPRARAPEGHATQNYGSALNGRDLTVGDLHGLTPLQLTVLRNEPFARRGYIFRRDVLRRAFADCDWYRPRTHDLAAVERLLTTRERRNVNLIGAYQQANGLTY